MACHWLQISDQVLVVCLKLLQPRSPTIPLGLPGHTFQELLSPGVAMSKPEAYPNSQKHSQPKNDGSLLSIYYTQHIILTKKKHDENQSRFKLPLLVALRSLTFIWGGHPLASQRHMDTSSSPKRFLKFQRGIRRSTKTSCKSWHL